MEIEAPHDVCCSQKPWPGEEPIQEDAHVGTFLWQRRFCVPPLKQVLTGVEPRSLSVGQGFHKPQEPWAEKPLTQEPGSEKGLTPGQDLEPKLPSLLPLVGLYIPLDLP